MVQSVRSTVGYAAMPRLDAPAVDPGSGRISAPFQRLLIALYQKTGGSFAQIPMTVYLQQNLVPANTMSGYNVLTNEGVGTFVPVQAPGGPEQIQVLGVSPFIFTASESGFFTCAGGKLELSRKGGPYYEFSLVGGSTPLRAQDSVRVTWFGDGSPNPVVWFPDL